MLFRKLAVFVWNTAQLGEVLVVIREFVCEWMGTRKMTRFISIDSLNRRKGLNRVSVQLLGSHLE